MTLKRNSRLGELGTYLFGIYGKVLDKILFYTTDAPKVSAPQELIGAPQGGSVKINCKASAYPRAMIHWKHRSKLNVTKKCTYL